MERKTMPRIVALLLAVLLTCTSVFAVPIEAQAATNPTKITLSETKKDLCIGKNFTLKVKSVTPADASKSVTYKSSNKKVATVNASGKVTGKASGKATITVTSTANKKVKATCVVTVRKGVEKVQTAASLVMQKGKKVKLRYDITPNKGVNKKVTFKSSNTKVVKVNKKGKLTALKAGKATITVASADGGAKKKVKVTVKKKITPVTQVTLDKKSLALLNGASDTLHASVIPSNATRKKVYYVSSDTSVAVVNNAGRVVAKGDGTAKIYAYACDNMANRAVCTVTVTSPATPPAPIEPTLAVTGVTLDRTALELNVNGAPYQLLAAIEPSNAANRNVTWATSDAAVATVVNGLVTPVAVGKATITVTTEDGAKTATCEVTVNPAVPGTAAVTGVVLNSTAAELEVKGAPYQLEATIAPLNATNKDVTWSTSDASVATVADGLVTPVTEGKATITVTTADGAKTATCDVTVSAASGIKVTDVTLNAIAAELEVNGAPYQLKAVVAPQNADNRAVTWSSSSPNVAVVSGDGLVTPMAAGTTAITVTTADGSKTAVCNVTVRAAAAIPVSSVILNASSAELEVGGAPFQLLGVVAPKNADNTAITWDSSNTAVATVANGLVTPVAEGAATITVTTADGAKTATCNVTVHAASTIPVTSVRLNETEVTLRADDAPYQLKAVVAPLNASNRDITWSSTNPEVATVADGLITPVAAGTTVITVTTADGGKTATCSVTVTDEQTIPVTGVTLNATAADLEVGGAPYRLVAWIAPFNATNPKVTWQSSDPAVATVEDGLVSPLKEGTTVITVTTEDGAKTAACDVTVHEASTIPVTDLLLNSMAVELEEGGASYKLVATVFPSNASHSVVWEVEDPRVATVAGGVVTPRAVGDTKVIVKTAAGTISKEVPVTVRPASTIPVTGITLTDVDIELEVGGAPYLLRKIVEPANADNPNVNWDMSTPGVVTISEGGIVTPVAAGTTTITAVSADGSVTSNACTVRVVNPAPVAVTGVTLDCADEIEMTVGQPAYQVTAAVAPANAANKNVTWSSSDDSIATVAADAENGNVARITPVSVGEATITVTTEDGNKTASCKVIVKSASTSSEIILDPTELELIEGGETGRITATVISSDGGDRAVTWTSADDAVATVAASEEDNLVAVVTPVGEGTTTVKATTEDGGEAECTVTVVRKINALEENPYSYVYTLDMKNAVAFQVETTWNGKPFQMEESVENVIADYKWFSEQFAKTTWRSNMIRDNWHKATNENVKKLADHSFIVADVLMGMATHNVKYDVQILNSTEILITVSASGKTKEILVTRTDNANATCDLNFKMTYDGKERDMTLSDITIKQGVDGVVNVVANVEGISQMEGSQLSAQITPNSVKVDRIPKGSTKGTQVALIEYVDDAVRFDINKTYYEEMMGMFGGNYNPIEDVTLWNVYAND